MCSVHRPVSLNNEDIGKPNFFIAYQIQAWKPCFALKLNFTFKSLTKLRTSPSSTECLNQNLRQIVHELWSNIQTNKQRLLLIIKSYTRLFKCRLPISPIVGMVATVVMAPGERIKCVLQVQQGAQAADRFFKENFYISIFNCYLSF